MKNTLKKICTRMNIEYVGIAPPGPYEKLAAILGDAVKADGLPRFTEKEIIEKTDPRITMADVRSIIVCLFPYYSGYRCHANISMHAWSRDYHKILHEMLDKIGQKLAGHIQGFRFMPFTDTGPLTDRYLAYLSGLGFYGRNNFIINEKYGSFVFIGYILNNYPFIPDKPLEKACAGCGECVENCPGKAISENSTGLIKEKCVSYITQKKGVLTEHEKKLLRKTGMVYGCDICQEVCPHNRGIPTTPLLEFARDVKYMIGIEEIGETNSEFQRRFGERAFAWRGRRVLERNIRISYGLEEKTW